MHQHRTPQTCNTCADWPDWARHIAAHIGYLNQQMETLMSELDTLTASVQAELTVEDSAITLIKGLSQQIAAAGTDPAALTALTQQLDAKAAELSAAVSAATPAPAAPPAPVDVPPAPAASDVPASVLANTPPAA